MIPSTKLPKIIFYILSLILILLMPQLAQKAGPNGDEDVESVYGKDIYNYWANGDTQALDYNTHELGSHIKYMELYGGLLNLLGETGHRWFGWEIIESRHFFIGLLGALMMIFTGLLAYLYSGKNWWVGLIGLLLITFSPRLFGESFHNGKDIPLATGIIMSMYFAMSYVLNWKEKLQKKWVTLIGLIFGVLIAFGGRPAGGIIMLGFVGVSIFILFITQPEIRKHYLQKSNINQFYFFILAFIIGYALCLISWPFGLQNPIGNLWKSFAEMSDRSSDIRTLFEGKYYSSQSMPWYYTLKWIFISSPIIVLLAYLVFILLFPKMIKLYGKFAFGSLLFCSLFIILYITFTGATVHDTWRHSFFIYPFWAAAAALAIGWATTMVKKEQLKWLPMGLSVLALSPEIAWTATTTPYQYIYFNAFTGGLKGAEGQYDLDYYQISNIEIRKWMQTNAKPRHADTPVIFLSNMDAIFTNEQFMNDSHLVYARYGRYYERATRDWDYFATYGRFLEIWQLQNNQFPPCNSVFNVTLKGVVLSTLLHRPNTKPFQAYQLMSSNNFKEAADIYAELEKVGICDENEYYFYGIALAQIADIDGAIDKITKATQLNGSRSDFYGLLAQLYQAKGDKANADKAKRTESLIKTNQITIR